MELRHFKWDSRVGGVSILVPFPIRMARSAWTVLADLAERLFAETLAVEQELLGRPELQARIGVPRPLRRLLASGELAPGAARVARFDFRLTDEGWRISEINSD